MAQPTTTEIELVINETLLYIKLNRPKRKNAFSVKMYDEVAQAFKWAADNSSINVAVRFLQQLVPVQPQT